MVQAVAHIALGAGVYLAPHVPALADTLLEVQGISSGLRSACIMALTRVYCVAPLQVRFPSSFVVVQLALLVFYCRIICGRIAPKKLCFQGVYLLR